MILDRTGCPPSCWLLALQHVCYVLNRTATESLEWQTPLHILSGVTPDISSILQFQFWEPIYYSTGAAMNHVASPSFPSTSAEAKGRFVGIAESVGDALTYKILSSDTKKILYRSYVRTALTSTEPNLRLDSIEGEISDSIAHPEVVKTARPNGTGEFNVISEKIGESKTGEPNSLYPIPLINPEDLINRTYLTAPDEDDQRFRVRIVKQITDHKDECVKHPSMTKFLVRIGGDKADEIVSYNDLINYVAEDLNDPDAAIWRFKDIIAHEGPLKPGDRSYNGSSYNVLVVCEDGSRMYQPLSVLASEAPVVCALYAKRAGLLDTPCWKQFKHIAKNERKLTRMLNQAKLTSYHHGTSPIYQFGFRVPRSPKEAIEIDKENGNTLWQDAMSLETSQLQEYETFHDLGKNAPAPLGYRKIRVHFVFAVKHDGRHKARLVADGHLTAVPLDSVYSGVVTLRSLRLVIFLAELNGQQLYGADVSNAYLEAKTREKVYIIAGAGFGHLEGHTLVIYKALYGLKSSGKRWHEKLHDTLRAMNFFPSFADADVWMREANGLYEYIAVYVDDLAICSMDPEAIITSLQDEHQLKLKGVGPLSYHLGCDFQRDPDGTLACGPKRYIEKMLENYERMFGEQPRVYSSPLEKNDHPELDDSNLLEAQDITKYQSMIGALQWCISLGRFDFMTPVMTLGRFRVAPRIGHLERLKRIYLLLESFIL
jgi:Reverse transcriptase (RNA-dependent DNA polymerase)